jgi:hypothetical protein
VERTNHSGQPQVALILVALKVYHDLIDTGLALLAQYEGHVGETVLEVRTLGWLVRFPQKHPHLRFIHIGLHLHRHAFTSATPARRRLDHVKEFVRQHGGDRSPVLA